ncbi:MAG: transcriptional regulator [Verrucomicrobiaceae bacterium]|nr:transcriptional regulator [Verrucomicrobiaceae bacterium]
MLHSLIREYPLATIITQSSAGIVADHIPLHLRSDGSPFGTLVGHVARNNPLWKLAGQEIFTIFHGPDCYISPSWWYATKQQTGKVVPTWNYVVVHAYGTLRAIDDSVWVRAQLEVLTHQHEQSLPTPWAVDDAPREFTDHIIGQIVGIEIKITRLQGKRKVSQNQPDENRTSVMAALRAANKSPEQAMANLVEDSNFPKN